MARYTYSDIVHMFVTLPTFPIFIFYLTAVWSYRFWRTKIPVFDLKWLVALHNVVCVLLSLIAWLGFSWFLCVRASSLYSKTPDATLQSIFMLYDASKLIELADTLFMMMRHKRRQISSLHVYHHASMLLLADGAYRLFPWPCFAVPLGLNSFVHVLVYSYYLAASIGFDTSAYKRRLTQVQLVQFLIGVPYCAWGIWAHGFCIYGFLYDMSMIYLFGNFYTKNYLRSSNGVQKHEICDTETDANANFMPKSRKIN